MPEPSVSADPSGSDQPPDFLQRYRAHGAYYRNIDDFTKPWQPSPVVFAPQDLPHSQTHPKTPVAKPQRTLKIEIDPPSFTEPQRKLRIFNLIRRFKKRKIILNIGLRDLEQTTASMPPVPLSDWKAWGYYAFPRVNGGCVYNASPAPIITVDFDVHEMFDNLRSPGGTHYRNEWIRGTKHPALPPRPERWKVPTPGQPLPFPWECQLNPFLVHKEFGASPVIWDIGTDIQSVLFNVPNHITIPLGLEDRIQPATFPFLTHLWINAVADDPSLRFPWPVMVRNQYGVLCEDVFAAVFRTFQEVILPSEIETWTWIKREQAYASFRERAEGQRTAGDPPDPYMRRVDYFGRRALFRGLSSNSNRETPGWVLHIGHN